MTFLKKKKKIIKISCNEYGPQQYYLYSVIRVFVRDPIIVNNVIMLVT